MNEGKDFSCALFDGRARLVALGADSPSHIFRYSPRRCGQILDKYGGDISDDDVFIVNDPGVRRHASQRCGDGCAGAARRRAPVLFGCVRAHWADIGGMVPGSLSGRSTEIYQEGVRIPPIRVVHRGTPNAEVLDLLFRNVRLVDERIGDYHAMRHGCGVGVTRVGALIAEYGFDGFAEACARLEARAERRLREAIRARIAPGRYVHEEFLDSAGHGSDPVPMRVLIDCADGHLRIDFLRQLAAGCGADQLLARGDHRGQLHRGEGAAGPVECGQPRRLRGGRGDGAGGELRQCNPARGLRRLRGGAAAGAVGGAGGAGARLARRSGR